jgi:hypothetical protein
MTNYDIFDEPYYLAQYPWVKPAIDAGIIKSGREHFEKFGQAAGLTKISRYFDEATYLAGNPDITPFVRTPNNPNVPFATGLDHFIQYGYEEGRSRVSPNYDEAFYVATNRDLRSFIENNFKSGYQHFIQFGIRDRLLGTSFLEAVYLNRNRDIGPLVNSGALTTGREHYFNFGKNEPNRTATFIGTSGNDTLTGIGVGNVELVGVTSSAGFGAGVSGSDGSNEFDTLIGGPGADTFVLAQPVFTSRVFVIGYKTFYIGPGFATIRNFTQGQDSIQLARSSFNNILVFPINNNRDLAIQTNRLSDFNGVTSSFDTLAVIEGGGNLKLNLLPPESDFSTSLIG